MLHFIEIQPHLVDKKQFEIAIKVLRHDRFFRNFADLRGYSRGNPRSGLIFMWGYHIVSAN